MGEGDVRREEREDRGDGDGPGAGRGDGDGGADVDGAGGCTGGLEDRAGPGVGAAFDVERGGEALLEVRGVVDVAGDGDLAAAGDEGREGGEGQGDERDGEAGDEDE